MPKQQTIYKTIILIVFGIGLFCSAYSQTYKFKVYGIAQGICHPFIYTINQDKNGYIWFGTGEGLCYYDGFNFQSPDKESIIKNEVVSFSYEDELGNLWFGFNNGKLAVYDGNKFTQIQLGEEVNSSITGIVQTNSKSILVSTLNHGLYFINDYNKIVGVKDIFEGENIYSVNVNDNKIILGTRKGLAVYQFFQKENQVEHLFDIIELENIKVQIIKKIEIDKLWIGTEDEGLYLIRFDDEKYSIEKIGKTIGLEYENIQDIHLDDDGELWISTFKGLYRIDNYIDTLPIKNYTLYNQDLGFASNFIKKTYQDREGNIWIATYGQGLVFLVDQAFSFFNFRDNLRNNNVLSVTGNKKYLWVGGENGILQINNNDGEIQNFYNTKNGLPADQISALYFDKTGFLWVGTLTRGLYKFDLNLKRASKIYISDNSLGNSVNNITGDNENIYIATKDGICIYNKITNKLLHYNTINGLPHNDIEQVFLDSENQLLFATKTHGIRMIDERGEVKEYLKAGDAELELNSITQDIKGGIWASTYGSGIFHFHTDSVVNITSNNGLKSDYCYSIIAADSNAVWVGHRIGISRVSILDYAVKVYDVNLGISGDCNLNSKFLDPDKALYFGSTDGLIKYDLQSEKRASLPPKTNITKVIINDKEYNFKEQIVLPYSTYKLRIEFIGLNYKDPQAVTYRYKLNGYDLDWSDFISSNYVIYPRVEEGEYTFLLRSYNGYGISEDMAVSFQLKIKLPVWKKWWFIILSIVIVILTVLSIVKIRERKQKQIQEYLERRLDERTREVVEQKEEIEVKNRDITDSINYAQRIQTSILPPVKKLQQNFAGSFVYYQPRDIVSGDFYWFDKVSKDKFIIVCADSTGHGVPGAFMSMIGTTLIKDICMREETNSPSDVLRSLDNDLRLTLNQNIDAEQSNDGMDIIVCEIDVNTNYLRYASAMRPMIVYKNGEQMYIKGSRSSVGGHYDKDDKIFKNEGIQLGKGDIIYMFSDGYPDQFGGPMYKKFKMVRLKNLLRDIHNKPMEEQYEYVKSTFNLWKENLEQVDDVLFMGIKL